jgi:hypothetical protein
MSAIARIEPSHATGVYELPDEQRELIRSYVDALLVAKAAGVAGEGIQSPQRYIDKVVSARVADARTGGEVWQRRRDEMAKEMSDWQVRMRDRGVRELAVAADRSRASAALEIRRIARDLDRARMDALCARRQDVRDRDKRRMRELFPGLQQPELASLDPKARGAAMRVPGADSLLRAYAMEEYPVTDAALAKFAQDALPRPYFAILYGAWAATVEGDEALMEEAFGDEAEQFRSNFLEIPQQAWEPAEDLPF